MAQIDIKETTIKIFDGTLGVATIDFTAPEADMIFTAKSRHIGSDKISITFVDPGGTTASLTVVVTGRDIVVNLARVASAVSTIASVAKAAIEADADANALVTVTYGAGEDGTGLLNGVAKTYLNGQKSIAVKIGEGTLSYSESRAVEFTRDRGILDTVRLADEDPMDLSLDATWEYITAESGSGTPTLEDAFKKFGEAVAWLSTADDQCQPYCVDVELWNAPACAGTDDEIIMFEEYYYEKLDHNLRDGTIATSGRCNRKTASPRRVASTDIP
jgi:hypothetical protein